ncbi:hypothetical protein D1815_16335 [Aquimarina sp. AD1]|uniref:hypothetical protein n=1 Tax=Aquimarina sp. (strain AD1) TaxID=1714848 RepID=UPI000E4698CC|nr:hypothetical protein [Aquimarina sp. AD1]AXT57235.1 hypothetical protein D1815_16335 [Aquimarina sp. AD1]RKN18556.1 hypothetical protein D7035_14180 [Aquimarina sp. AD1]
MMRIVQMNPVLLMCLLCFLGLSCNTKSKNLEKVSSIETKVEDTLAIGYTYWWPQNGPFIGNCGEKYSLVFLGTINEIYKKTELQQYTSQRGIIRIGEVLISKKLKNNNYQEETYISSDCFANVDVKKGDKVIVFCYEYEGSNSIPGGKSILKINDGNDPIVTSIKRYIQSDQNPLSIEDDVHIWDEIELGSELRQIISCKKTIL